MVQQPPITSLSNVNWDTGCLLCEVEPEFWSRSQSNCEMKLQASSCWSDRMKQSVTQSNKQTPWP